MIIEACDVLDLAIVNTNLSNLFAQVQLQAVRTEFDYVDDHFYVDHPRFLERSWSLPSQWLAIGSAASRFSMEN